MPSAPASPAPSPTFDPTPDPTPKSAPADPYAAERATVRAVRRLLRGCAPGDLPRLPEGGYGKWAALFAQLCAAHAQGGTRAVEQQHVALATTDPEYCLLVCGDLPPAPTDGGTDTEFLQETRCLAEGETSPTQTPSFFKETRCLAEGETRCLAQGETRCLVEEEEDGARPTPPIREP